MPSNYVALVEYMPSNYIALVEYMPSNHVVLVQVSSYIVIYKQRLRYKEYK